MGAKHEKAPRLSTSAPTSGDRASADSEDPTYKVSVVVRRYFQALYDGWRSKPDRPVFQRFGLARRPTGWLATLTASELPSLRSVICFGSGPDAFTAVRNLSLAIAKGEWREDRYAHK